MNVPLSRLAVLFCALFVGGILLTLPLFKFNVRKFIKSKLFIKTIFWVPIFLVFVAALYMTNTQRLLLIAVLFVLALREMLPFYRDKQNRPVTTIYFLIFSAALFHFYLLVIAYEQEAVNLLITIGFASVLSDVAAFFFGNYLGFHKLPAAFNAKKSWEGVFGQIFGALVGVARVNASVIPVISIWLFLPIGLGAAIGDLTNSFVKRKVGIKDWSNSIPGHGGYIDRLSSLVGSAAFTFYFLLFTDII